LTKRSQLILTIAVALLVPCVAFADAANKVSIAQAIPKTDNVVVIPIEITNNVELAAIDIPLQFSEGLTLKEVDFTDTRVDYFDFKAARIDNETHNVVIGLLPQFSPVAKPDLAVGQGIVANLVFEITDPDLTSIEVETIEFQNPNHSLSFIYHGGESGNGRTTNVVKPDFTSTTVALSNSSEEGLPATYALFQNYPNPFNPTTSVSFDLPSASKVELVVYNVLGQKVATLVDGPMEAGNHVVEVDGSSMSSGLYFYKISANNFSDTKKMVLLK
jgi:hypothetical protein